MRTSRRSSIAAGLVLACTALTAAACGSGGGGATADGAGNACAPTPGVTRNQVNLGLLYSGSGIASDTSTLFRAGVDARLGAENKAGGVNGRTISYILRDDASTANLNLIGARDLAAQSILGVLQFSAAPTGSVDLLEKDGLANVNGQIVDPEMSGHSNIFSYARPLAQKPANSVWGEFVAAKGGTRAVTVAVELSTATQTVANMAADSLRAAGVQVVGSLLLPPGAFDPRQFGEQIKATKADSLVGMVPASMFYQVVAGARAAGVDLKVALGNPVTYDRGELASVGSQVAGSYAFLDYAPFELNSQAHARFLSAIAAYSPQVAAQPEGSALIGWISADMLLAGLKAAGPCPTRQSLIAGLRSLDHYDADGLLPAPISLRNGLGNVTPCYDFVQVTPDGTGFTPVQPLPRCGRVLSAAG